MPLFARAPAWRVTHCFVLALLPMASKGMVADPPRSANVSMCNVPLGHQILQANDLRLPAAAVWLNATQIQWPQGTHAGTPEAPLTWRLLASRQGTLQIQVGQAAVGHDQSWPLHGLADVRQMPALSTSELRSLHASQLVLVQEDRDGRVQQATRIQAAKALDTLFAPASLNANLGVNFAPQPGKQVGGPSTFALWAPTALKVSVCLYMRHLKALAQAGMTDLHLLPVFDFATVPETNCQSSLKTQVALSANLRAQDCFNWGYDPLHFNAPEGSYASDAEDGAKRILEFRQMVKALHEAGLRVGMDMVYNHTSASGQHLHSVLDRIVPGYYHRLNAQGEVERSTCCDNTATEHLMMGKLMSDSVLMWAQHYKIDSFRFDLMGHQPRQVMVDMQQRVQQVTGRRIDFVGEGWNFGEVANGARFVQASQLSLNGTGIGTFNDRLRDAIRGGGASDAVENLVRLPGFVSGQETSLRVAAQIRAGLAGSLRTYRMMTSDGSIKALQDIPYGDQPTGYASQPSEVVNYAENHDNLTLFDSLAYKLPLDTPSDERARVQHLASALTAFSQGIAYFHAGMDILRSKSLDGNSYDSGDAFNLLDWSYTHNGFGAAVPEMHGSDNAKALSASLLQNRHLLPTPRDIAWTRDAFRDVLKIRHSTELLRLKSAQAIQDRLTFLNTELQADQRLVVGHVDGRGLQDFQALVYFVNVAPEAKYFSAQHLAHQAFELHPVLADAHAADQRIRQEAKYTPSTGGFNIPARSAVVFIVKGRQP
ncbi:MAG: DUF3372 domain-containing protein [Betaproteobacteria bacterium]|nr:DUF3372 domain-containing protein [Betaproteobacteria bacterium]